jgi:hypothetical protein
MKQILQDIGLGDGEGNTSSTRVVNLLVAVYWLASKFYNAHLTKQPIIFDSSDLEILGVIGGISIGKTIVEKPSTAPKTP